MTDVEKKVLETSLEGVVEEPVKIKKSGQHYQCMGFVGFQSIEELCLYADAKGYWIGSNTQGAVSPEELEARVDGGESLQSILGLNVPQIVNIEFVTPAESQHRIAGQIAGLDRISRDLKRRTRIYYGEDDVPTPKKANGKGHKPVIKQEVVLPPRGEPEEKVEFENVKPLNS